MCRLMRLYLADVVSSFVLLDEVVFGRYIIFIVEVFVFLKR